MLTHVEPELTVRDVASYLNVDEKTIYRLVTKGELPGFKVLASWRFQRSDIEAWINRRKEQAQQCQDGGNNAKNRLLTLKGDAHLAFKQPASAKEAILNIGAKQC